MVKLTGPMFGLSASGRLGDVLQYNTTARDTVGGRRRNPTQPRTRPQRATRLYMSMLATAWSAITSADQASWDAHPSRDQLSRYHAYLKHNANRYKNLPGVATGMATLDVYPSTRYPTTIDSLPGFTSDTSWTQTPGTLTHNFHVWTTKDNWIYIYHLNTHLGPLPTYADIVQAVQVTTTGDYSVRMTNLDAGQQDLRILRISRSGQMHNATKNKLVTIT